MSRVTIRRATIDDLIEIKKQQSATHADSRWRDIAPFDDVRSTRTILDVIERGVAAVAINDETGGVVGSVGFAPLQMPWSDVWFLNAVWYSVDPPLRKNRTALAIVRKAEEIVAGLGPNPPRLLMGVAMGGDDAPLKDRFMRMMGFAYLGGQFMGRKV